MSKASCSVVDRISTLECGWLDWALSLLDVGACVAGAVCDVDGDEVLLFFVLVFALISVGFVPSLERDRLDSGL